MIFKRENKYLIYRFILTHIFTIIALANMDNNYFAVLTIWFITVFLFNISQFFFKTVYKIETKENNVCLYFFEFFLKKKVTYNINVLNYSYTNEAGAKGIKSMDFRIYENQALIIKCVGRSLDGWTNSIIYKIIEEFKKLGIKEIE
jgi:hypothetical protein